MDPNARFDQCSCFAIIVLIILACIANIRQIKYEYATTLENEKSKNRIQLKSFEELSNHLERLLDPKTSCFTDVTIKSGSVSIPAHKNILSARSPVFAAMFSNSMNESHENKVDITDIDTPILRALLTFIYTGKTNDLSESSAADLLFAADKYQLQSLKSVCSGVLKDTMSIQNVLRLLVLGDLYAEDLKSRTVDYICNEITEFSFIENTQEWKTLLKERPDLAMYVLTSLVNYKK